MKSHTRINEMLKHREAFRPFAPIVLEEHYSECFEGVLPIPYMLETRKIKANWREKIPAVCHVDNSARVQIVNSQNSPKLNELIEAFYRLTEVPVLINTSLNRNGEWRKRQDIRLLHICSDDILHNPEDRRIGIWK